MIVKSVRQFPKKKRMKETHSLYELFSGKRKRDYFYPLIIEMTQRYGMIDFENFFSEKKE